MYILGINAYHGGASAGLINDGQRIAAVEEERLACYSFRLTDARLGQVTEAWAHLQFDACATWRCVG